MAIDYLLLVSRQGKVRLAQWYIPISQKEKTKILKDLTKTVLARKGKACNFVDYKGKKVVYRKYASLYFIAGIKQDLNELIVLEVIHRFVEVLDKYFGNVCELDLIFNFQKAYFILNEYIMSGEVQEASKKIILRATTQQDEIEAQENSERSWGDINLEGVAKTAFLSVQELRQAFSK